MDFIKGFTFGFMTGTGNYACGRAKQSLKLMKETTASDTVILALAALQQTAHSEAIDFTGAHMPSDEELVDMIRFAQDLGLRVILKPLVNCSDGTWRAHINFFDNEVPCEPKWSEWYKSYTAYQLHYAKIAEQTCCEMLIIGCEMVQAQRKEEYWRQLIAQVRKIYSGLITYNTDKYQEENVSWWDAVDVISSSGYYPVNDWPHQLARIEAVVKRFSKPFFFAEAGCPSVKGSSMRPNDWTWQGDLALEEQAQYYKTMFEETSRCGFVQGLGLWDWNALLYKPEDAPHDKGYGVYLKPANQVIFDYYSSI